MSVLFISSCVREESRTARLAAYFLENYPDRDVQEINLARENIAGLDRDLLHARDKALAEGNFDDPVLSYAKQFSEADTVVIAAPFWDYSFPASLKTYIERINCVGVTFAYDETGNPYGMCRAKHLVYISTAGGPLTDEEYGFGYIRKLSESFYGIPDIVHFYADNLDLPFTDVEGALAETMREISAWILTAE